MAKATTYPRPDERPAILAKHRNLKMARSPQAYVRGSTQKFYEWLKTTRGKSMPHGPSVWICGDCHNGNLGPVANAAGEIAVQIRDLDQTVIGNPAHDLIRLGLSLAMDMRGTALPGVTTAKMLEQLTESYEHAIRSPKSQPKIKKPKSIRLAMRLALKRNWKILAKERIQDTTPTIPFGRKFWPLTLREKQEIYELFRLKEVSGLATKLQSRNNDAEVEVVDAAYWMKGCSSLGLLRYAVLVRIGGKTGELCLMDIKEAAETLAPRHANAPMPRDNGKRVVQGAEQLAPFLGDRMISTRFCHRSVFIRELLPQDMKIEFAYTTFDESMKVARYLARVLGVAHARQMDAAQRRHWRNELIRRHTKSFDAPSWLWGSVVELVSRHESAYLEHCRRYALNA